MEVSRLRVELELQLLAYATAMVIPGLSHICSLRCGLLQSWILNPLGKARDRTSILLDTPLVLNLLSHNGNS